MSERVKTTATLLARIVIAKIEDDARLVELFRTTSLVQDDPNWRCRTWVALVLARLKADGTIVGTSQLDWPTIKQTAREYVGRKKNAGRYQTTKNWDMPRPT
jgi:hypothetical protein